MSNTSNSRKKLNLERTYHQNIPRYNHRYPPHAPYSPWYPNHHWPPNGFNRYHHVKQRRRQAQIPRVVEEKPSPKQDPPQIGTEEYNMLKIQESSSMIMKHIMSSTGEGDTFGKEAPAEETIPQKSSKTTAKSSTAINNCSTIEKPPSSKQIPGKSPVAIGNSSTGGKPPVKKAAEGQPQQQQQQQQQYNVKEIHEKIMHHISNLNYGKKINLICSTSSSYDAAIQHIQAQKRLELSKALNDMCVDKTSEKSDYVSSIMPDIGIAINQLPLALIQELSVTLGMDFSEVKREVESEYRQPSDDVSVVKEEPVEYRELTSTDSNCDVEHSESVPTPAAVSVDVETLGNTDSVPDIKIEKDCESSDPAMSVETPVPESSKIHNTDDNNFVKEIKSEDDSFDLNIPEADLEMDSHIDNDVNCERIPTESQNASSVLHSPTPAENLCPYNDLSSLNKGPPALPEGRPQDTNTEKNDGSLLAAVRTQNSPARNNHSVSPCNNTKILEPLLEKNVCDSLSQTDQTSDLFDPDLQNIDLEGIESLDDALQLMIKIDRQVARLTAVRQEIFLRLKSKQNKAEDQSENADSRILKRRKRNVTTKEPKKVKQSEDIENDRGIEESSKPGCTSNSKDKSTKKSSQIKDSENDCDIEESSELGCGLNGKDQSTRKSKQSKDSEHSETDCDIEESSEPSCESTSKDKSATVLNSMIQESTDLEIKRLSKKSCAISSETTRVLTSSKYEKALNFNHISEKVIVIKVISKTLLVGCESGKLLFINLEDGWIERQIQVASVPITALCWVVKFNAVNLFVGSFQNLVKVYGYERKEQTNAIETSGPVQCFEVKWDFIFIGTTNGHLSRYSIKKNRIIFDDIISFSSVFVIKATREGARRVLLVGARNAAVCIRDAMSGLHMRIMSDTYSSTVYALLLENSLVYCGTTTNDILVFNFHNGTLLQKYTASKSKSIGCMRYVGRLLFAGCHDGKIYVYNTSSHQFVDSIQGPGGVILSMEVVGNLEYSSFIEIFKICLQ